MNRIRNFLMGAACLISMAASAQWQWTDKDGRKVFSDRAPPADILEKNILKRPGGRGATARPTEASAVAGVAMAASAPQGAASAPKLSGVDKDLTEKKKKTEEAEALKRKAEEERVAKAKVENCTRAKQAKAGFDSGVRIARTNDKGEREVMDEVARTTEVKRIQSIIDADCK
ncbi:DUF4124 domain-containing protein [Rhodoferax ferrireducens]|uniref:DUF4124 domain-containing protein n=1 Tax=Rhodoferax ferrireducens TaxID=192843 RepID=UPI000E0E08F1|nr:DUF4124 domain-containing protein [Rhodoferax ferrireducens]